MNLFITHSISHSSLEMADAEFGDDRLKGHRKKDHRSSIGGFPSGKCNTPSHVPFSSVSTAALALVGLCDDSLSP